MNKYIYYILLFSIFGYGIFLRFYDLGTPSFWIDEGYSSIVSYYAYINNFSPLTPFGNYDFSQYFFTFFQSLSFSIFGVSDFSSRLPSAIFSIFSLIIAYFFSRDLLKDNKYRDYGVLFITFLFTFSSWQIIWSREARFYELLSFLYLFSIWSLYRYCTLKIHSHPELQGEFSFAKERDNLDGNSESFKELDNDYIKDSESSSEGQNKKLKYLFLFSFSIFLGLIFHPFCFSLLLVGYIFILYEVFESIFINFYLQKRYKKTLGLFEKNKTQFYAFLSLTLAFLGSIFIDFMIRSYTSQNLNISSVIPTTFDLPEEIKKGYIKFYLQDIFSHIGFIFISFIVSIFYFSYNLKSREFILFGLLFFINFYIITQKGFMAHTRYMFHLYGIMTILGGYVLFAIFSEIKNKILPTTFLLTEKRFAIKLFSLGFLPIITLFLVFYTFDLIIIHKAPYDIDYTSPKPNFKGAYNYLSNKTDKVIISGFPHICSRYNLSNQKVCKYALRVNLTGDEAFSKKLKNENNSYYTNTPYIDKIEDLSLGNYYFVLDDLTIKNSINKEIINYVMTKCDKVYSDLGDNNYYNNIGVYKCIGQGS